MLNLEMTMRKLIVAEHISLDGVVQAPGGQEEDSSDGFRLGGWSVPYVDDTIGQAVQDWLAQSFELLLGRRTYDIWAAYWPHVRAGHVIGDLFNRVPKHVVTHRPDSLAWQNSHALVGEIANAIGTLKQQDGPNLLTWGSADLVHQLLETGLVDEFRLMIYPVIIGSGKRLFGEHTQPSAFILADAIITPKGVMITSYKRSGEVRTGTFDDVE